MRRTPLALVFAVVTACAMASPTRASSTTGRVDFRANLQPIDGFGFSQAFQRADVMHGRRLSVDLASRSLTTVVLR
jgi:glucosylceramidase